MAEAHVEHSRRSVDISTVRSRLCCSRVFRNLRSQLCRVSTSLLKEDSLRTRSADGHVSGMRHEPTLRSTAYLTPTVVDAGGLYNLSAVRWVLNDTQHGVGLQTRWGQPGHVHNVLAQRWRLSAGVSDMLSIETGPNGALVSCSSASTKVSRSNKRLDAHECHVASPLVCPLTRLLPKSSSH